MKESTKRSIVTMLLVFVAALAGVMIGVVLTSRPAKGAVKAGPCTTGFSFNADYNRITVYNWPLNLKGNSFRVVYSDGDDLRTETQTPKQANGVLFHGAQRFGTDHAFRAYRIYSWRNGKPCANSGVLFGGVG